MNLRGESVMKKAFYVLFAVLFLLIYCGYGYAADFPVSTAAGFQSALTSAESNGEDDVITLAAGTYSTNDNGGTFDYDSNSSDEGTLSIVGNGEVILDGGGTDRVLDIDSEYMTDITLQKLNIRNGYVSNDGAGAYVYIDAGNINIMECSFKDNSTDGSYYGGGLYAYIDDNGNIDITSCDFTGNYAYYGGGVYSYIEKVGDMTFNGNTLTSNSTDEHGGGGYLYAYVGDIEVIGNTCTSNDAGTSYYGGALYIEQDYSGTTTVDSNIFRVNSAGYGGALYFYPSAANVFNCLNNTFENNYADSDGGALDINGNDNTSAYLFNNSFNGNKSGYDGGGAYLEIEYGDQLDMVSCDFYQNVAGGRGGGGVYLYLYDDGTSFYVDNCSFRENESYGYGGGLCFYDHSYVGTILSLTNSLFENNRSTDGEGGGAYIEASYGGTNIFVSGNEFSSNSSYEDGGGLYAYVDAGNFYVGNNTFDQNVISGDIPEDCDGGGAYLECESGDMTVENCSFTNNLGGYNGGGVYAEPYYGDFIFRNNLVTGNTSTYDGGGAYFYPEYVRYADIVNNTVTGNTVTDTGYYGGGIYVYCGDDNTVYSIYNNIVWDNTASDGNDIYLYDNSYLNYFYVNENDFSVLSTDFSGGDSFLFESSNMDVDPLFVSTTDFRLQETSPVIDMGNSDAPSLPDVDLEGNSRINGAAVDMGAYEFSSAITKASAGSSGGCNTGAFVPSLILLLAPLFLLSRKR